MEMLTQVKFCYQKKKVLLQDGSSREASTSGRWITSFPFPQAIRRENKLCK